MSVVTDDGAAGNGLHDATEIEGAGLLAWRKFSEALQPLSDIGRRGSDHEDVVDKPPTVIDAFILAAFQGIAPQVTYQGSTEFDKRFAPDIEAVRALFEEGDLPLVVA